MMMKWICQDPRDRLCFERTRVVKPKSQVSLSRKWKCLRHTCSSVRVRALPTSQCVFVWFTWFVGCLVCGLCVCCVVWFVFVVCVWFVHGSHIKLLSHNERWCVRWHTTVTVGVVWAAAPLPCPSRSVRPWPRLGAKNHTATSPWQGVRQDLVLGRAVDHGACEAARGQQRSHAARSLLLK